MSIKSFDDLKKDLSKRTHLTQPLSERRDYGTGGILPGQIMEKIAQRVASNVISGMDLLDCSLCFPASMTTDQAIEIIKSELACKVGEATVNDEHRPGS